MEAHELRRQDLNTQTRPFYYPKKHQGKHACDRYDRHFYRDSHRARVWEIERSILSELVSGRRFGKYVDFACGTGRVTCFLETLAEVSIGVDVSEPMLAIAKTRVRNTRLLNLNIVEQNSEDSGLKDADLITAFRFFLNADAGLRAVVLKKLVALLSENGMIIFNIHGNKASLRYVEVKIYNLWTRIWFRVTGRQREVSSSKNQMSVHEVEENVREAGLRVQQMVSYAVLPSSISKLLPRKLWLFLESKAVSSKMRWGTHLMFVCTRSEL